MKMKLSAHWPSRLINNVSTTNIIAKSNFPNLGLFFNLGGGGGDWVSAFGFISRGNRKLSHEWFALVTTPAQPILTRNISAFMATLSRRGFWALARVCCKPFSVGFIKG
jgi:hypothetical protein